MWRVLYERRCASQSVNEMEVEAVVVNVVILAVAWILVPAVLLGAVGLARSVAERLTDTNLRDAALSGWWAGLLIFVLFVLYQLPTVQAPVFYHGPEVLVLNIAALIAGFVGSIAGSFLLSRLRTTRLLPFATMGLTFLGGATWYHYDFTAAHNEWVVSVSLGIVLGLAVRAARSLTVRSYLKSQPRGTAYGHWSMQ